jgi:hypothetical protein
VVEEAILRRSGAELSNKRMRLRRREEERKTDEERCLRVLGKPAGDGDGQGRQEPCELKVPC